MKKKGKEEEEKNIIDGGLLQYNDSREKRVTEEENEYNCTRDGCFIV